MALAVQPLNETLYEGVADCINPAVSPDLGIDNTVFLENSQMLGHHRLGLLQAGPELAHTGLLAPFDGTEHFQAQWMSTRLEH